MKPHLLTLLLVGICLLCSANCYTYQDLPADISQIDNNTLSCWKFFLSFVTHVPWGPNITEEVKYFQLYSGHNINDLGEYRLCKNQPTQKYTIIEFVGLAKLGFCGPAFCDVNKMERFSDLLNHALANLSSITKLSPDLEILNVVDPDEKKTTEGSMLYFTIGVLVVVAALAITGTAITNITFFKKLSKAKREPKTMPTLNGSLTDVILAPEFNGSEVFSSHSIDAHFQNDYSYNQNRRKSSRPSMMRKIIGCFDINQSIIELFKTEDTNPKHDQNLKVLNGVRALIFGWVVYGHTFLTGLGAKNIGYILPFTKSAVSLIAFAALYAVDTFFYLSGFFIGFILIEKLKTRRPGIKNYLAIVLHRWLRLWPAYMVALLFFWKVSVYMGSGPVWYTYTEAAQLCNTEAWKNALLLDNVLSEDFTECMSWAWYIACDFQIFLLTPFICWIYLKKRSRGLWIIWSLIGVSIIAAYAYTIDSGYTFLLMPKNDFTIDFMSSYYVNPVARMSPYLLGLWLGILFREYKRGHTNFFVHLRNSKLKSFSCLILGLALLNFLVFFPRDLQTGHTWSDGFAVTWGVLTRPLWAIGVFMFTAPSLVGNFKGLTNIMGNQYFTIISKLSYTGYLVHFIVIFIVALGTTKLPGVSQANQTLLSLSCLLVSCAFAMVLHLLVEKPVINIEKVFLDRKKDHKIEDNQMVPKEV